MRPLKVSTDRRWLVSEDHPRFFWTGDTAWELFHRLTREEAGMYLTVRKQQGFNVVQAALLAELDGLRTPNAYGHAPLIDFDSQRPNEAYFQFVDEVLDMAEGLGIHMAVLPAWGDKVLEPGDGPRIFHPDYQDQGAEAALARAYRYGKWIGQRFRHRNNLVWVLGGDRDYHDKNDPYGILKQLWREMAKGLSDGDGGKFLRTFHVCIGSSIYFPGEAWLDFHMTGSYHFETDLETSFRFIERDYRLEPSRPTLDSEPRYEDHPVNWDPAKGYFDAYDTRQAAYWSMLAGACGHTYGCHDVWQFSGPKFAPVCHPRMPWGEALLLPGAVQMGYLRKLVESRPFAGRVPAQHLLADQRFGGERVSAMAGPGYIWAYSPRGCPFQLDLSALGGAPARARWLNPRTGKWSDAGLREACSLFVPPSEGRGEDWLLEVEI